MAQPMHSVGRNNNSLLKNFSVHPKSTSKEQQSHCCNSLPHNFQGVMGRGKVFVSSFGDWKKASLKKLAVPTSAIVL